MTPSARIRGALQSPDPAHPGKYRVRVRRQTRHGLRWVKVNRIPLTKAQAVSACGFISLGMSVRTALRLAREGFAAR